MNDTDNEPRSTGRAVLPRSLAALYASKVAAGCAASWRERPRLTLDTAYEYVWVAEVVRSAERVNRGGSWNNDAQNARAANRNSNTPDNRNNNLGLRLARAQPWTDEPRLTRPRAQRGGTRAQVAPADAAAKARGCPIFFAACLYPFSGGQR